MSIRDRILARRDLDALRAARDLDGLAAALNAEGITAPTERYITLRTILAECPTGPEIVTALRQAAPLNPVVDEALNFLRKDSGFDVGHPNTARILGQLVEAGAFSAEGAAEVLALALQLVVVSRMDVEAAMFNPDGSEK